MNNLKEKVIQESEKFLREKGAEKYRAVNVMEFMKLVSENNLAEQIQGRKFKVEQIPLTQVYVKLNEEYIYNTLLDDN